MNNQIISGEKYVWKIPVVDQQKIAAIASQYNLSFAVAQVLHSRGFSDETAIEAFLFSSFEDNVADARLMKDAEKAVDRLLLAMEKQEQILVFGDYDVDGITSSSLMMICLLPLGAKINYFLPNRVKDGYGLSTKIVERAAENKYSVIVTVDNGITAIEQARRVKELGLDLIITDHHRPHSEVPDAFAIVNPNQVDCPYPHKTLAGVGVTFKLLSLLYEKKGLQLPPKAYELLLLGTVADVVPLIGENRFWVRHGLNYINKTESLSFKLLKANGKVTKPKLSSMDIGFSITPQINALGRLEDPRQAVKFLIGTDVENAERVARVLLEMNEARKAIEKSIVEEIEEQIRLKHIDVEKENVIIAASKNWPAGVIGLVASRFVSAYGKPTLLFHLTKDGLAKGSCRSIAEFNMFDALTASSDLIMQFGGHSVAAGLSLKVENLAELKSRLETLVASQLTPFDLQPKIKVDAEVALPDLTKKFIDDLEHLEPFGNSNDQPIFYVNNVVQVQKPQLLKDAHVKCFMFADGVIKPVIFFNRPELFALLNERYEKTFILAARVSENYWQDRVSIELIGVDIAMKGDE
ncbi:MAG TPA: single-stranded-DNA-specific exonuclease RecJ [Candidatus Babeliales bacterium]|jgi:single-stranded-DNA-specific exonuclease|nr:single-stranded-DNA-specific exonuclease RecJ [Candidatus Babeliales bacterium]